MTGGSECGALSCSWPWRWPVSDARTRKCREQYVECEKANEQKAKELKSSRVDDAIAWIKSHKTEVALGTVFLIGGVAFVLTTGGAGALVLAPVALQVVASMSYNSNFDVDAVMKTLGTVSDKYPEGSPEDSAP